MVRIPIASEVALHTPFSFSNPPFRKPWIRPCAGNPESAPVPYKGVGGGGGGGWEAEGGLWLPLKDRQQ